ncbi:hypothetical protein FJ365_01370 [Candidatus Dependentiae bacterium]|nr:hypothetical protein [Candidatus Dependentiae bacterium]
MNKALLTLVALTITVSANVNVNAATGHLEELLVDEVQEQVFKDADGFSVRKFSVKPKSREHPLRYNTEAGRREAERRQSELNEKAADIARTLQEQHDAAYAQAVKDAHLPLFRRVVRFFTLGKKQEGTSVAVPVYEISKNDTVEAISERTLSTRAPKLKTEIVNTKAAAQTAAITQAITATQQAMADAKVTTAKKTPTTNPSRFMTILKNHKGKIAAGTIAAVALALGAYYGIPAYQAYQATKAYEATYWGKFATTVAKAPFVPSDPRRIINAFMLR